jgi:hypothetical protein
MKTDSVTAGKTRVLLVAALAFMAQGAWSEERSHARAEAPALIAGASETVTSAPRPVEIDIAAYIEAFNKRLTEKLSREIEALNAARIELAMPEVPTRG